MKRCLALAIVLGMIGSRVAPTHAANASSSYRALSIDTLVQSGLTVTLLEARVLVVNAGWLFAQSDGRYYPQGATRANAWIEIDGNKQSNDSLIDWRNSTDPQQHSFNVIAAAHVQPGLHTVVLRSGAVGGRVFVGAGSNLSVLVGAAAHVMVQSLAADTGALTFYNDHVPDGAPLPSHRSILRQPIVSEGQPLIVLASGRSYLWSHYGDPMWGIFFDGKEPSNAAFTWTDNDLYSGAEEQAPMFNQAYFVASNGTHAVSLEATSEPYQPPINEDDVVDYRIGAGTRLITLQGGLTVFGHALNADSSKYAVNKRFAYVCIDSKHGWPTCPRDGSEVVLARSGLTIPVGHNGVVFFAAKTRVQGGANDRGTVSLYLKLDGYIVGSVGVQQLGKPNAESTRTVAASYLAAAERALRPGRHTIEVLARANGTFEHLSVTADLPLVWFD